MKYRKCKRALNDFLSKYISEEERNVYIENRRRDIYAHLSIFEKTHKDTRYELDVISNLIPLFFPETLKATYIVMNSR